MKTDDLVSLLAESASPVSPHAVAHRFAIALALGISGAAAILAATLGLRPDLMQAAALPMFWFKLAFPASLAVIATVAVQRLARPGMRAGASAAALLLPIAVVWLTAAAMLIDAAPGDRQSLILGSTWRSCPLSIAMVSSPVLVAVFWALKGLAPTRLVLSGAMAGLLAGAVGALVYALHCTEMQPPFLGVWYVVGMAIPALAGAALGPRLLRW